jgi:hypothetical protein
MQITQDSFQQSLKSSKMLTYASEKGSGQKSSLFDYSQSGQSVHSLKKNLHVSKPF